MLVPYLRKLDCDGAWADLEICRRCTTVINRTALDRHDPNLQTDSAVEVYQAPANRDQEIDYHAHIVETLLRHAPDLNRGTFADIGAGRGFLAEAAARYFEHVWAIDNPALLKAMLPPDSRVSIGTSVEDLPPALDAVIMWHVVEHLPDAPTSLKKAIGRLRPGGAFYFQVPTLRRDYIVATHYTFLSETSARTLCADLGLTGVEVGFGENDDLTCFARKPQL